MKNLTILVDALDYIENNLCSPIKQENIADFCYCSLSGLQKLFRYAFHFTIKEYISKRRLTLAAKDLSDTNMTITDIAMKYQYNSPEVFTRAFSKLWNIPPSAFKTRWKSTGLFPKIQFDYYGGAVMPKRKTDISELYDYLKSQIDTYVICFDIVGLMSINAIDRKAGDMAILKSFKRIDEAATEDMLLFRIGGDEFALVTGYDDEQKAKKLAQEVLAKNGQPVYLDDKSFPVAMWAGITKMVNKNIKYDELFSNLQNAIDDTKKLNAINQI